MGLHLVDLGLRLGQRRCRLDDFEVQFRGIDLGKHVAPLHPVADVDHLVLQIPRNLRKQGGRLEGVDRSGLRGRSFHAAACGFNGLDPHIAGRRRLEGGSLTSWASAVSTSTRGELRFQLIATTPRMMIKPTAVVAAQDRFDMKILLTLMRMSGIRSSPETVPPRVPLPPSPSILSRPALPGHVSAASKPANPATRGGDWRTATIIGCIGIHRVHGGTHLSYTRAESSRLSTKTPIQTRKTKLAGESTAFGEFGPPDSPKTAKTDSSQAGYVACPMDSRRIRPARPSSPEAKAARTQSSGESVEGLQQVHGKPDNDTEMKWNGLAGCFLHAEQNGTSAR